MTALSRIAQKLRDVSAKRGYACDVCGAEIFEYPKKRLCVRCAEALALNNDLTCVKCGRKTVTEGVCLSCKAHLPLFTRGVSPLVYRSETAAIVNRVKNGNRRLAYFLGEEMAESFLRSLSKRDQGKRWLIVPVPMTEEKRLARGYNQAEDLAHAIALCLQKAGVDVAEDYELLQKLRENEGQKHLGTIERAKNVVGSFHVHKRKQTKGANVLLVDDIMTTGATGCECARVLFAAGAAEVVFLTAAALSEQK